VSARSEAAGDLLIQGCQQEAAKMLEALNEGSE
jgi:hypothetical protein